MDRTRQRRKMHIAGLLAFLLLATAMLSLRLFDGGAASGTVNVGGMFTYETGFSAGARAATAANGLPAYLTDGNMQTYPGSSLGASYSYANAGAYVSFPRPRTTFISCTKAAPRRRRKRLPPNCGIPDNTRAFG